MATWPVKRMDELCEITSSKRIFAADYVSEGVPFIAGVKSPKSTKETWTSLQNYSLQKKNSGKLIVSLAHLGKVTYCLRRLELSAPFML